MQSCLKPDSTVLRSRNYISSSQTIPLKSPTRENVTKNPNQNKTNKTQPSQKNKKEIQRKGGKYLHFHSQS